MSLYERAYQSAKHYGLELDFVESYNKALADGYDSDQAVMHALYEWDIILLLDEHGVKDANV